MEHVEALAIDISDTVGVRIARISWDVNIRAIDSKEPVSLISQIRSNRIRETIEQILKSRRF